PGSPAGGGPFPLLLLLIESRHPPDRRGFTPPDRPRVPPQEGGPSPSCSCSLSQGNYENTR
ncbi:MAG: hypothetical protein ACP5NN_03705, partial [Methanolinea sp.]